VTGALHAARRTYSAAITPLVTKTIDVLAYDGRDIRQEVSNNAGFVSALVLAQS
jgi:hypothetical protein